MEPENGRRTGSVLSGWVVGALILAALIVCGCVIAVLFAAGGLLFVGQSSVSSAPVLVDPPISVGTPTPLPSLNLTPAPPDTVDILAALESVTIPPRDRYLLAARFRGISDVSPLTTRTYDVGDVETFFVDNDDIGGIVEVDAEMVYRTDHVYMWIELGQPYDHNALVRAAQRFEDQTYPIVREYFGSEPSPGIDGDPALHVLNSTQLGEGTAGYYYSPSEYPRQIVEFSNEKEMFLISLVNTPPGSATYNSVLAHEFQHMVHWNVDANEESWLNEGLSEVAAMLDGHGMSEFAASYLQNPDLWLTGWPENGSTAPYYGGGFLFATYFLDRFGDDALKALVAHPGNGLAGADETLADLGAGLNADDVFQDWVIANWLNDTGIAPEFGYERIDIAPPGEAARHRARDLVTEAAAVNQYGADYIVVEGPGETTFRFTGSQQISLIPANTVNTDGDPATNDEYVWWSVRADDSNTSLMRAFDLSGVDSATLDYDIWYWIEDRWDYGYVTVSTDGGESWDILKTPHTTTDDPHGTSYGEGYTGRSDDRPGANPDGWLHESLDLTPYVGGEVLIRFEMITDDALNQPGMAVDNICIAAIGFCDDAESDAGGWTAEGYVRHNNILPQIFAVQVILPRDGSVEVFDLELDATNTGEITLDIPALEDAVIVVSGMTRFTSLPAAYEYELIPAE